MSTGASRTPAEWARALADIEQSLAAAEAALAKRETALAPLEERIGTPESAAEDLVRRLDREGDVVAGLAFFVKRAQESAKEAAYAMREKEMAIEEWSIRAKQFRQRLAEWDSPLTSHRSP
jgi:hypothetical protein